MREIFGVNDFRVKIVGASVGGLWAWVDVDRG